MALNDKDICITCGYWIQSPMRGQSLLGACQNDVKTVDGALLRYWDDTCRLHRRARIAHIADRQFRKMRDEF